MSPPLSDLLGGGGGGCLVLIEPSRPSKTILQLLRHLLFNAGDHLNARERTSLNAKKLLLLEVCVDACSLACLCVHREVDCCAGGGDCARGCRAPNEGARNKISAPGSSSARRLPQTPSD